jgi:hypothetical protein
VAEYSHFDQRVVRNLRAQAGDSGGILATGSDVRNEVDDRRHDGNSGELEAPLEDGEIGIEPLRSEQRAARGTGDADDSADPDVLSRHGVVQRLHVPAVLLVAFGAEEPEIGRNVPARARAHEHFRDEPAAGMRQQIDVRVLRQRVGERHRIGDRD